ncbi:MAG: hypothetical protein AB8B63_23550 [Granulosicoccus sp.]
MREQLVNIDEYAGNEMFPISLLWQANHIALDKNFVLTDKFIIALINTGMTLYYLNEDFDGDYPFVEFPLSDWCVEEIPDMIGSHDDYIDGDICVDSIISNDSPAWFSTKLCLKFQIEYENQLREISTDGLRSDVGLLLVRCFDVMKACQLQGIDTFYWPRSHTNPNVEVPFKYTLGRRAWTRHSSVKKLDAQPKVQSLSTLHKRRLACLKKVLLADAGNENSELSNRVSVGFPPVKVIYGLIRSHTVFMRHNVQGAEVISFNSFNQDWKKKYRTALQHHFDSLS